MKTRSSDDEQMREVLAIDVWENEGGAPVGEQMVIQYGRRIEADRTWTIYHVFTGVPAVINGKLMTGMSDAASLNSLMLGKADQLAARLALPLPFTKRLKSWFKRQKVAWR